MNDNNYVIIMAGGIGSRFWPFSRSHYPKQFQDILGTGKTLIQQTAARFQDICPPENIYVVTNKDYKSLVKEQLPFLGDEQLLLEPAMRNTAPCIAYATYKIHSQNPNAVLTIAPSDHIILREQDFERVALSALEVATKEDILVTLGITPTRPDTGYGYIQYLGEQRLKGLLKVKTFTEKPNLELAESFIESGDFVWNSGIFISNAESMIRQYQELLPDIAELFEEISAVYYTEKEPERVKEVYYQCSNISIDYGIMEYAPNVYVIPCEFGWSDLGTWKSLFELSEKDGDNNVLQGNITTYHAKDCIVKTPEERLVVIEGLEGYIVAEKDNVLLICPKDQEQRIKQYLNDVKIKKGSEFS